MTVYFRLPDQLAIVNDDIDDDEMDPGTRFTLTMRGTAVKCIDYGNKTWWLVEPDFHTVDMKIHPEDDV